jgi:hypothetical protein
MQITRQKQRVLFFAALIFRFAVIGFGDGQ